MKLFFLIIIAISLNGCDLFSTRSAEPPTQPRADYQQPVTADILISNLVNSLKDKNVENYVSCLADYSFTQRVYTFSASSGALSQFPSLSENWGIKNEEQYFNNMISKVPQSIPITLKLSNERYSPQGDSLVYTASYTLNVPSNDPSLPENYAGDLRFNMIRDSRAVWSIYYWQDSKNGNPPSWSELKGRTY